MTAPTPPPPAAAPTRKKRWPWIVAAVVVLLGIGAAVGGKKGSDPAPAAAATSSVPAPSSSSAPTNSAASSAAVRDLGSRPRPDAGDLQVIAAGLTDIQPEMAEITPNRVESWTDSMCGDIWLGAQGNYTLPQLAVKRFAGGDRPPLSEAQGQQIVDLISKVYCA